MINLSVEFRVVVIFPFVISVPVGSIVSDRIAVIPDSARVSVIAVVPDRTDGTDVAGSADVAVIVGDTKTPL
jgi:hypothetical protein